jgi:hypothetical protein
MQGNLISSYDLMSKFLSSVFHTEIGIKTGGNIAIDIYANEFRIRFTQIPGGWFSAS